MIPIHELLNRIRWDPEFAEGDFQLGNYDRAEDRIILVLLKEITFPEDSPQTFQLADAEGQVHRIPFHRVREVYRNAQRIWHRPDPSAAKTDWNPKARYECHKSDRALSLRRHVGL